jgi:uncharacterized protein (TIGR00251 family)
MSARSGFHRHYAGGVELFVRLTPKSSRDAVEGVEAGADGRTFLRARVRAVPENGKANQALEKLLASAFGVPASSVSIVAGGTSRLKTVRVAGAPELIEGKLALLCA